MAASRGLPVPLVIVCLVLIRGYSPLPTTSGVPAMAPKTPTGDSLSTEDYRDYEGQTDAPILPDTLPPLGGTLTRCNYDPCLESQVSCAVLKAKTGCLCPGFTSQRQAPEIPNLRSVSWNGSEVVIHWCAPYSYVTAYIVTVGGKERQRFGGDRRIGGVGDIDEGSEVCVAAVNDVATSKESCEVYQPRDHSLPLKAGLIGGALGLLLLLLLAVLLCRHKRQRKQQASISMRETAETQ
ncbi:LRRN4 C-terminal-like protein [Pagrus major]|uniref:LRRN4 C-terminal-like protein n=1 Tax=Pagrus major TaxID=143350 RepID=UPI003CC87369